LVLFAGRDLRERAGFFFVLRFAIMGGILLQPGSKIPIGQFEILAATLAGLTQMKLFLG
jgi:hypothetical protein